MGGGKAQLQEDTSKVQCRTKVYVRSNNLGATSDSQRRKLPSTVKKIDYPADDDNICEIWTWCWTWIVNHKSQLREAVRLTSGSVTLKSKSKGAGGRQSRIMTCECPRSTQDVTAFNKRDAMPTEPTDDDLRRLEGCS